VVIVFFQCNLKVRVFFVVFCYFQARKLLCILVWNQGTWIPWWFGWLLSPFFNKVHLIDLFLKFKLQWNNESGWGKVKS
jgi:hypothetical protein